MSTSARKEHRDRRRLQLQNDARSAVARQVEAVFMPRGPRLPCPAPLPNHTRAQVRSWMQAHAQEGYESATALAEAANAALQLPPDAMDDEGHWVWEEALSALERAHG